MLLKNFLLLSLLATSSIVKADGFQYTLENQASLTLISTEDKDIIIEDIKLNKGHCAFKRYKTKYIPGGTFGISKTVKVNRLPVTLGYGESFFLKSYKPGTENKIFYTQTCPLIRVDIYTNRGVFTLQ
jgi:hypothetical protein